jgi:hypothetical protein
MTRLSCDERTQRYLARRTAEGKSKREIIRCLKRYIAREVYPGHPGGDRHLTTQRSIYLTPAGLPRRTALLVGVDYQALGGYVVAPPSRHASGNRYAWARDLGHRLPALPGALYERLAERAQATVRQMPTVPPAPVGGPGHPWARSALAAELGRAAAAPPGRRNSQLWESGRNLFNLVAAGALDHHEVEQGLFEAAGRCGLLQQEPRQTRRTLASARQVGLAHPRRRPERPAPGRTNAPPLPATREAGEPTRTPEGR